MTTPRSALAARRRATRNDVVRRSLARKLGRDRGVTYVTPDGNLSFWNAVVASRANYDWTWYDRFAASLGVK